MKLFRNCNSSFCLCIFSLLINSTAQHMKKMWVQSDSLWMYFQRWIQCCSRFFDLPSRFWEIIINSLPNVIVHHRSSSCIASLQNRTTIAVSAPLDSFIPQRCAAMNAAMNDDVRVIVISQKRDGRSENGIEFSVENTSRMKSRMKHSRPRFF